MVVVTAVRVLGRVGVVPGRPVYRAWILQLGIAFLGYGRMRIFHLYKFLMKKKKKLYSLKVNM